MSDIFAEHDGVVTVTLDEGAVGSADELYAGNRVSKEGYFHVVANGMELKQESGKLPMLQVDMSVLDGSDNSGKRLEDQVEKALSHRIYLKQWEDKKAGTTKPLDERAQKGIRAFAYAFGLLSEADVSKPSVQIPFHMISGRQAVVRVQQDDDWTDDDGKSHKGSMKIKFNSDAWPVNHDRVKDVHKDAAALSMLIGGGGGLSDSDIADI